MSIQDLVREATYLEVAMSADECLKCNVCNTVCPVARVTDLFPGPKYVGPQAQRFRMATLLPPQSDIAPKDASPDHWVDYCSGCGMCTLACPADVKIAEINNRSRAEMKAGHRPKLRHRPCPARSSASPRLPLVPLELAPHQLLKKQALPLPKPEKPFGVSSSRGHPFLRMKLIQLLL